MSVVAPERAARRAASTLVSMPPLPTVEPAPPAMASMRASVAETSASSLACGFLRGSESYRPSMSVRMTSQSASIRLVTSAPNVSLSPKRISSVTTVSFSLITGTTPSASRVLRVERALR